MLMCCLSCAKEDRCEQADRVEDFCLNYEERPMTNADRIRAMSDEELADYLRWHNDSYSRYGMDWLDWLKSPVEVDNG